MSNDSNLIILLAGTIIASCSIGYAMSEHRKAKTAEDAITKQVNARFNDGSLHISQDSIDRIVEEVIHDRASHQIDMAIREQCDRTACRCAKRTYDEIDAKAREVVNKEFESMSNVARTAIERRICDIDIGEFKRSVRESAEDKIMEKLDDSMDDILEKFNDRLDSVASIYKNIADNFSK